jgi:hypothetical protein
VRAHLLFVWNAYWELLSDRDIGMAHGPIPFRAIDAFARRYGLGDLDLFDRFRTLIRLMEDAHRSATPTSGGVIPDPDGSGIGAMLDRMAADFDDDETEPVEHLGGRGNSQTAD